MANVHSKPTSLATSLISYCLSSLITSVKLYNQCGYDLRQWLQYILVDAKWLALEIPSKNYSALNLWKRRYVGLTIEIYLRTILVEEPRPPSPASVFSKLDPKRRPNHHHDPKGNNDGKQRLILALNDSEGDMKVVILPQKALCRPISIVQNRK